MLPLLLIELFCSFLSYKFSFPSSICLSPLNLCPCVVPPASPARSVVLDCLHVSTIDYSVVNELRDLLRQFKLRGAVLVFSRLQVQQITLSRICVLFKLLSLSTCLPLSITLCFSSSALCSAGSSSSRSARSQTHRQRGCGAAGPDGYPPQ